MFDGCVMCTDALLHYVHQQPDTGDLRCVMKGRELKDRGGDSSACLFKLPYCTTDGGEDELSAGANAGTRPGE